MLLCLKMLKIIFSPSRGAKPPERDGGQIPCKNLKNERLHFEVLLKVLEFIGRNGNGQQVYCMFQ